MYTVVLPIGMCDKGSHMCPLKCAHVAFLAYTWQCKKATTRLFLLYMSNFYFVVLTDFLCSLLISSRIESKGLCWLLCWLVVFSQLMYGQCCACFVGATFLAIVAVEGRRGWQNRRMDLGATITIVYASYTLKYSQTICYFLT